MPDLDASQGRSEAIVLTKTVDFLQQLIAENSALKDLASKHNIPVENLAPPQPPPTGPGQQHRSSSSSSVPEGSSHRPTH